MLSKRAEFITELNRHERTTDLATMIHARDTLLRMFDEQGPVLPVDGTLIGHQENQTFLVHRHDTYGDYWIMLPPDEDHESQLEEMRNRVIDQGGKLYRVTARATVMTQESLTEDSE